MKDMVENEVYGVFFYEVHREIIMEITYLIVDDDFDKRSFAQWRYKVYKEDKRNEEVVIVNKDIKVQDHGKENYLFTVMGNFQEKDEENCKVLVNFLEVFVIEDY